MVYYIQKEERKVTPMKITAIVNNLPNMDKYLAKNNGVVWITATADRGDLWYYGLWYSEAEAKAQARTEDKIVLKVEV